MNRLTNRIAPICLIAGPAALAASLALKPINSAGAQEQLDQVAAHTGAFEASTILQIVSAVLLVPGLLALLSAVGPRAAKLGGVAVGLLYLNTLGNVGDAGHGATLLAAAKDGVSSADVALVKSIDSGAIAAVIEGMVLLGLFGFPLLAVALWRGQTVQRWVPVLIGVAFLSFFAPINEGFGAVLIAVALGSIGARALPGRAAVGQPLPA